MKSTLSNTIAVGLLIAGMVSSAAFAQPMAPGGDNPHQIRIGLNKIHAAYAHLAAAGDDWGGHKAAAMRDLEAARVELEQALQAYGGR